MNGSKRVAIACQGGGSHTSFTAGVLKRILEEDFEVVGLSGTSGGAICALLAWYGLLIKDRGKSIELLDSFWEDNSTTLPWDMFINDWLLMVSRLRDVVSLPEISPYFYPSWGQEQLKEIIEKHVDFDRANRLLKPTSPILLVGAVDVLSGEFKVFNSDKGEICADAILASAAIPNLFRAVNVKGRAYWDGLFSQNPPVSDLARAKPDEIWIIQINPDGRDDEPKSAGEIIDRRNELAGNLSLKQELYFIEKINELVEDAGKTLDDLVKDKSLLKAIKEEILLTGKYKHIKVDKIIMKGDLDYSSKLDRSPSFIREMIARGEEQAGDFLKRLPRR